MDKFEEALKDLVSEQFKDNEVMPVRDETTGKFISDKADEHDEEVGAREKAAADNDDGASEEEGDEDEDEDEEGEGASEDEDDDEETPEDDEEDKSKDKGKRPRYQKRIDSLTATVRRLERDLRAQREADERAAAAPKKADGTPYTSATEYAKDKLANDEKAPKKPKLDAKDADGKPLYKLGEFDERYKEDYDDYLEDRREYLAAKRAEFETATSTSATDAAAAPQQEFQSKLDATIEVGKKTYKDFDEKVVKGIQEDAWPLSEAGAHFLVDSEVGADIAYALAGDVKLAKEIAALSPIAQIKRFTKLEDKFIAEREARNKPRVSGAPEPIKDKARGGGRRETGRFDSENFEDVEQNWKQANTKKR